MAEPSDATPAPQQPNQPAPQLNTQQQLEALTKANNISPQELAAASGQGMNPTAVGTVTARLSQTMQNSMASLDKSVQQVDHIVNGNAPITQGIVALANDQVKPREGYTNVVDRPDGTYIPGVADRLMAMQAAGPEIAGGSMNPGWQSAMASVQHMQAKGDVCNQVSGATFVTTTCVGGLSTQHIGSAQVSVSVGMRF